MLIGKGAEVEGVCSVNFLSEIRDHLRRTEVGRRLRRECGSFRAVVVGTKREQIRDSRNDSESPLPICLILPKPLSPTPPHFGCPLVERTHVFRLGLQATRKRRGLALLREEAESDVPRGQGGVGREAQPPDRLLTPR